MSMLSRRKRSSRNGGIKGSARPIVITLVLALFGLQIALAQSVVGLDATFGKGGRVLTELSGRFDMILAMALAPDGSIYAGGTFRRHHQTFGVVAKYTPSGSLDTTFGDKGIIVDPTLIMPVAVAVQPNGLPLVAATNSGSASGGPGFVLERLNTDGSLDATFGSGGKVLDTIGPASNIIDAITLQPNGQILIGGSTLITTIVPRKAKIVNGDFALARYNGDGTLDTSFGNGGKVTTDFAGLYDQVKQIVLQPNGQIIAAGEANVSDASLPGGTTGGGAVGVFGFARYNVDGSLDSSFGAGGKTTATASGAGVQMSSVALEPDGKIVAAGSTPTIPALVRLNADGALDSSFGQGGSVTGPVFDNLLCGKFNLCNVLVSEGSDILFEPDGTILLLGGVGTRRVYLYAVSYNSDGTLNTSFGTGGILASKFSHVGLINSLLVQPDGKVLAGGAAKPTGFEFAIARYNLQLTP
jgi:uncharacterized delta-60 repeat protein